MGPTRFLFGLETTKVGSTTDMWDPFVIFFSFCSLSLSSLTHATLLPYFFPPPSPSPVCSPRAFPCKVAVPKVASSAAVAELVRLRCGCSSPGAAHLLPPLLDLSRACSSSPRPPSSSTPMASLPSSSTLTTE